MAVALPPVLRRLRRIDVALIAGVFLIAAAYRMGLVLSSAGGLTGDLGYDPGVYYAGADALIHGRLPYADFVLLHPPGLMLVLAPFAAFGAVTSDHTGYLTAVVAFELLGAVNAVLVMAVARRFGLGRIAAATGGLFYAVWFSAAHPEVAIRLEPLGTAAFLLALLALGRPSGRRAVALGGVALGFAVAVKIWWIVPVAVVVGWWVLHRRTRPTAPWLLGGVALALLVVDGPFFAAAPSTMWRMVVTDQLGRQRGVPVPSRLSWLTSVGNGAGKSGAVHDVAFVLAVALFVALFVLAARVRPMRLIVLVAAVQIVVLIASPSFFQYYSGYLAAPIALVVGTAAAQLNGRLGVLATRGALVGATALSVSILVAGSNGISLPFPRQALVQASAGSHCVMADSPGALIMADVLSRDLRNGCPNWIDVTGRTYDVDASRGPIYQQRVDRPRWQHDLRAYLLAGNTIVLMRPSTGIGPALRRELDRLPVVVDSDGVRVYSVPHRNGQGVTTDSAVKVP